MKLGISQEQAKRKADNLPDGDSEVTRALQSEVRRLTDKLGKLGAQHQSQEGKNCNRCLLGRCEGSERCPAKTKKCNRCGEFGHFSKSTLCKRKKGVRKLQEEESSEEENVGRVETVAGVTKEGERDSRIRVSLGVTKQGQSFKNVHIRVLADTGVRRTILNLGDWKKLGGELQSD